MGLGKRLTSKTATPRKKACVPCSNAKVKCDQNRPFCTRCEKRGSQNECTYKILAIQGAIEEDDHIDEAQKQNTGDRSVPSCAYTNEDGDIIYFNQKDPSPPLQARTRESIKPAVLKYDIGISQLLSDTPITSLQNTSPADTQSKLNFSDHDLVCTINPQDIATKWLKQYIPTSDQIHKIYPERVITFISSMLNAYASAPALSGTLPPFVHGCQQTLASISPPLATCISLARLCGQPLPGSEPVILETLQREMDRLYAGHKTYGEAELLAAFQAYLIYALLIYFNFDGNRDNGLQQTMVNLQEIACQVSQGGLVSACELRSSRPKWESWIVAEAKRRTLYTMYLFDSILCARDGLPTFLGTELRGTPAPGAKLLWQATDRTTWSLAYNEHLSRWGNDSQLLIEELWPIPSDMGEAGIKARKERTARWALSLDEFGTMLYAVTVCTHGN